MSSFSSWVDANQHFFERQLWDPAFLPIDYYILPDRGPSLADVYAIELSNWCKIGAAIGFLDRMRVQHLLDSQSPRLEFSRQRMVSEPNLGVDLDSFFAAAEQVPHRETLQFTFRDHMLLTSELMGNPEAVGFLELLVGAEDDIWEQIVNPLQPWTGLSLESLCRGFARVLANLEAAPSGIVNPLDLMAYLFRPEQRGLTQSPDNVFRYIQSARFGLLTASKAARYFAFAGAIIAQVEPTTVRHIDSSRAVFKSLSTTIRDWIPRVGDYQNDWWAVFVKRVTQARSSGVRQMGFE